MDIQLTSSAFEEEDLIPSRYTCDGTDISPPLAWEGVPEATQSIAIISDDPDAPMGTWVHWVIYNIPPEKTGLSESIPNDETLADGTRQGISSFGETGYGGPCPPSGTHRYYFKIYALDRKIDVVPIMDKDTIEEAMQGHILAQGQLMGRYKRNK